MKIIIAGAGAVGTHLAKLLSREDQDIVLMDENAEKLAALNSNFDLMTVNASPTSIAGLKEANAAGADLFIGVTPEETKNMTCCMIAHAMGAKKTVARIDNYEYLNTKHLDFFKKMGINSLIYPEMLAAKEIVNGIKMSWARQWWEVHNGALTLLGIKLRESAEVLDQPLKDLCGPDTPYHIVAIKRDDEIIIPRGDSTLKLYDIAYFMTTRRYIPYIRKIVGKENYADVRTVMIMGGGRTAMRAAINAPDYMNIKIIEQDEKRCERLNQLIENKNVMIINGDGRDISLLMEEGIERTEAFVALTPSAETNILACLNAKRMGVRKTVAMVENLDYVSMAENLDIGTIINKKTIAASHIYQLMLDADVTNVKCLTLANADVAEFVAKKDSKVTQRKVKDLGLPKGVTIGGLVRDGEGMLVSGDTLIKEGDSVVVFCIELMIKKIEKFFN
jgi:trk system potassium uptake protein TrkA